MKTRFTSIKRNQYRELVNGMMDGSLLEKVKAFPESNLTKSQRVLGRQVQAIGLIAEHANQKTIELLKSDNWKELYIIILDGNYYIEVV